LSRISKKDLEHIGELLAVKFDARSPQISAEQLSSLLTSFGIVQEAELDAAKDAPALTDLTKNAPPSRFAILRKDKVGASLDRDIALDAAPHKKGDFISIKPVF